MRKIEKKHEGKTYLLVFSLATLSTIEEDGIDMSAMKRRDGSELSYLDMVKIFVACINSGAAYAEESGLGEYEATTVDRLLAVLDMDDIKSWTEDIVELVKGARNVKAEPPKNAKTTPAKARRS